MVSEEYKRYLDLYNTSRFSEAANLAEQQAVATDDKNVFWLTQQAKALLKAGEHARAYEIGLRAVRVAPANQYALCVRADAALKQGMFKQAEDDYRELFQHPKLAARARWGILASLALSGGQWTKILGLVSEWNLPPREALPWKVRACTGLNRADDAIDACREWLRICPHNPKALWQLTELEIKRDGLETVLSAMARTAKIPSLPPVYSEIYASLSRRAGKTDTALGQYEKLSRAGNDPRILRKQAFVLAKSGREAEALPLMEELLRINPRDLYLHSAYSAASRRIHELERALTFYEELHGLFPEEKTLYGRIKTIQKALRTP